MGKHGKPRGEVANSASLDYPQTQRSSYKLDYPIEILGHNNFPAFYQGFTAYQGAKKSGGPDLKSTMGLTRTFSEK